MSPVRSRSPAPSFQSLRKRTRLDSTYTTQQGFVGDFPDVDEADIATAASLFLSREASTTTISQATEDYVEDGRCPGPADKDVP
jgi:hypothetical protein